MTPANIKEIAEAGADMFVAGSAIFNSKPSSQRPPPPAHAWDAARTHRPLARSPRPRARACDSRLQVVGFALCDSP